MATYLLLRYTEIDDQEALALFDKVASQSQRHPDNFKDLRAAFIISRFGPDAVSTHMDLQGTNVLIASMHSGIRAMILHDEGDSFLRLITETRTLSRSSPELEIQLFAPLFMGLHTPQLILDQSDEFKLQFAIKAEAASETIIAGLALASRSDLGAYEAFLRRHATDDYVIQLAGEQGSTWTGMTLGHQSGPLEIVTPIPLDRRAHRHSIFDIQKAGYLVPQEQFLTVIQNMTGREEDGSRRRCRTGGEILFGGLGRWRNITARPRREIMDFPISRIGK